MVNGTMRCTTARCFLRSRRARFSEQGINGLFRLSRTKTDMIAAFRFCLLWRPPYGARDGPGQAGPETPPPPRLVLVFCLNKPPPPHPGFYAFTTKPGPEVAPLGGCL